MVEIRGFKPRTSALPALRSNQLSYIPAFRYSTRYDVKFKCLLAYAVLTDTIHSMKKLSLIKSIRLPKINYKKVAVGMVVLGLGLAITSGVLAYNKLYLTQEKRFWLAVDNSLRTQSVVKEVQQGGSGNKQIDKTRYSFGAQPQLNKTSSVSEKTATSDSNVTTETLQTEATQFIRYLNISTNQKKESGGDYDFSSIKNMWAKQADTTNPEDAQDVKLSYVQAHVTLVPFGNLPTVARRDIVNQLRDQKVYDIAYESVRDEEVDGEMYVLYPTKVVTKKYVAILQKHFTYMGYGDFPPFDPAGYAENARVNAQILVRKRDNVIAGIVFNTISERYTNYGVSKKVDLPKSYISIEELQEKLGSLQ